MKTVLVVVHWNRPEECIRTVQAFRAQGLPLGVIVVDNGSGQRAQERLERALTDVVLLRLAANVGWGPAVNVGLRYWLAHHDQEWVLVAPHDALPHVGCLHRLCAELERNPRAGIACAEYGEPLIPGYSWWSGATVAPHARGSGWQPVHYPHGTLMAFRRAMLLDIGTFDDRYFAYGEETEFGYRARRSGWEVGQVWGAVVSNPIRAASSRLTWYLLLRNSLLNVYQVSGVVPAAFRTLVALGAMLRPWRQPAGLSAGLRLRAIRDFWTGRLGPPPADILNPA
jgi:GT2 family glycosyltransferase